MKIVLWALKLFWEENSLRMFLNYKQEHFLWKKKKKAEPRAVEDHSQGAGLKRCVLNQFQDYDELISVSSSVWWWGIETLSLHFTALLFRRDNTWGVSERLHPKSFVHICTSFVWWDPGFMSKPDIILKQDLENFGEGDCVLYVENMNYWIPKGETGKLVGNDAPVWHLPLTHWIFYSPWLCDLPWTTECDRNEVVTIWGLGLQKAWCLLFGLFWSPRPSHEKFGFLLWEMI